MMTVNEVLKMVDEYEVEKKNVKKIPHYYMRKGVVLERSYPDYEYSEKYYELAKKIRSDEAKVFKCECCGKMQTYFDLEAWNCDFDEKEYICSYCYEEEMGEDL